MRNFVATSLLCAAALAGGAAVAATPAPLPTATPTAPPQIYRIKVRPLCSALHGKIAPAVGMMLQNDATIAKSPKFFDDYAKGGFETESQDPDHHASARQNISVLRLENLVSPLVNNILAIQKMLEDPNVFPATAQNDDDRKLLDLKKKMLTSLANQQAAVDIINGFVTTQQLDAMQHEGFGYISSITGGDVGGQNGSQHSQILSDTIGSTPDPLHPQMFDNTALNAGLKPNPYEIDLTRLPGLALGYNPVSHLKDGVQWTQGQSKKSEDTLAKSIIQAAHECGGAATTTPESPAP